MSRRRFVGGLGVAAAACVLESPASALAAATRSLRVAVLVPASVSGAQHTRIANGLRAGFEVAESATRTRFLTATQRYGIGLGVVSGAVRQALSAPGITAAVVVADSSAAGSLKSVSDELRKPIFLAEPGGNVADPLVAGGALPSSSLGYWQAAWALGEWAAANVGKRAFICASLRESGYDSLYAFHAAFEEAGGDVVGTAVSHVRPGETGLEETMDALISARPDVVYAAYGGTASVEFMRAYSSSSLRGIPLLASGFAVDESLLSRLGSSAVGVRSCLPWAAALDTPGNRLFTKAYGSRSRVRPDALAALAFDTAVLTARTLALSGTARTDRLPFATGGVTAIPGANLPGAPLYLREVRRIGGALRNVAVVRLGTTVNVERHAAKVRPELRTGWLEPYMGA